MYGLSKKQKLDFILEKVTELDLSAYEISKGTNMTEAGISRIIRKVAKNPHENSLNKILEFLESKVLGSGIGKNIVQEPKAIYEPLEFNIEKYIKCIETESILRKEIDRLKSILHKNKIAFDDNFEE